MQAPSFFALMCPKLLFIPSQGFMLSRLCLHLRNLGFMTGLKRLIALLWVFRVGGLLDFNLWMVSLDDLAQRLGTD